MTKELDELLCKKYPDIFRDRQSPMHSTSMCWGFDCGDGWFALIDTLCASLMHPVNTAREAYEERVATRAEIDAGKRPPTEYASDHAIAVAKAKWEWEKTRIPIAMQVKEKFGGLRFYVRNGTDEHDTMIDFAESMSYRICEICGTTKDAECRIDGGWHRTLCIPCMGGEYDD